MYQWKLHIDTSIYIPVRPCPNVPHVTEDSIVGRRQCTWSVIVEKSGFCEVMWAIDARVGSGTHLHFLESGQGLLCGVRDVHSTDGQHRQKMSR